MGKALFLLGAIGAGAAAVYLMDEKEGKKRRAKLKKKLESGMETAEELWDEYSHEFRDRAPELKRHLGNRAQYLGRHAQDYLLGARERAGAWSRVMGKNAQEYAKHAGKSAADYAREGGKLAGGAVLEGQSGFKPSARMIGAVGSALAFYGAGRRGLFGMVLRTLSLGLFLRALFAAR
jgi:gas vesicle protein